MASGADPVGRWLGGRAVDARAGRAGHRCIRRRSGRAARRATRSSGRRSDRPARAASSRRLTVAAGSSVCSSGRSARRLTRCMMTSASALSQIETALSRMRLRVSSRMKAPPPVASTAGPLSSSRAITRASPSRKYGSPWVSKMSGIDMPAAASISMSASRNGSRSRAASRRPMVDLPAPIMPTSTTERFPSAAAISASWGGWRRPVRRSRTSKALVVAGFAAFRVTYTTPGRRRCQRLLQRRMGTCWMISMVNSPP